MAGIENYLQEIEEQRVKEEKQIQVVGTPVLGEIYEAYKKWLNLKEDFWRLYPEAVKLVQGIQITSRDITEFSLLMNVQQAHSRYEDSGLFVSALINTCKDKEFEVITKNSKKKLNWLGIELRNDKQVKRVKIKGSAGWFTGKLMSSGYLTVTGNAGLNTGDELRGGYITIEGNVERGTGDTMKGGEIIVKGNAGKAIGHWSEGGEIYIGGIIEGDPDYNKSCKAKIYCGYNRKNEGYWRRNWSRWR